jgi:hypothetical protein
MSTFVKKVTSAVAGLAIVFSIVSPIAGVSAAFSGLEAAQKLSTLAIIEDQSANPAEYRLGDFSSREELSKVISKLAGLTADSSDSAYLDTDFADWSEKYAKALNEAGIAASNTYFNPKAITSKIEALKWVMEARDIETGTGSDWMEARVNGAVAAGIAVDFSDFNAPAERGQVFIWAAEAIAMDDVAVEPSDPLCELLGICEEPTEPTDPTEPTTPVVSGDDKLMVSLSPLSPTAGVVAAGKSRTPLVAFDVTAGSSDVSLDDIVLGYVGLSDSSVFDELSVYMGNNKVTKQSSKGFDSDEEADLTFENDTVIQAGKTVTLVVTGLVNNDTTNVAHQIKVLELEASSTVELGSVKSVVFGTVAASNTATLDIDVESVTSTPTIGETITLAAFTLEEKLDNEDVIVKSVTLEFGGGVDAEDDIADLVLLVDGVEVASDLMVNDDDEVIIDLEFTVEADESYDFELEGVITGSIGQTLTVTLTEVYAIGADTGIIAGLTGDALSALSGNFATVDGAEINVSFDKGDADEAKPGAEDVLVGTLSMEAASDYTVNELTVTAVSTGTGVLNIVKDLELDGKGFDDDGSATSTDLTVVYTFEDISLDAGIEELLELTLEIEDEVALNGATIDFTIAIVEVEDEDNDETFTSLTTPDLNSVLSSNSFDNKSIDIETASYKLTQSKVSQRDLVLGNGIEVVLYRGKLNIGDADSVNFKDFTFNGTITSTGSYDFEDIIDSATLNIGGVTDSADVEATAIEFNSANIEVAAGADNVEVLLTAVLKDNDSVNNGDLMSFTLVAADVVAEDSDSEDLVSGAGVVTPAASATIVKLNERGTFSIAVVNDGENEDDIEEVVLAGSSSVTLAEVVLEAEEEDMDIEELRFTLSGAFDDTIENVRLMNGSAVLAEGATVTLSGSNTIVEFEDFTVSDTGEEIDATLVADLNTITTEGGVVSATAGDIIVLALTALDMDVEGASSNDAITADLTGNVNSNAVAVVPVVITLTKVDGFNEGDTTAIIGFDIDMGNNDLDNDDVVVTSIIFEAGDNAFLDLAAIRNDDGTPMTAVLNGNAIDLSTDNEINNGDEFTLTQDTSSAVTAAQQVVIVRNGVTFTVDGQTYTIVNDSIMDLDSYKD